jgi:Domain of unknown function (DUF4160)
VRIVTGVTERGKTRHSIRDPGHHRHVPRICEFYGIVIEMYYGDHPPPHFHARYGGDSAKIEIASGDIVTGSLPSRALRLVREWLAEHRGELEANWQRATRHEKPKPIDPLR